MPWWGHIHIEWSERIKWGAKQGLFLKKNHLKIPSYLTCRVEVTWFRTVPLLNYPRWHDRHFKVHKCKVRFGISLMLASYLWKLCFTLVLSPSLEDEQRLSVRVLLTNQPSTPAAFHNISSPNLVVGLISNKVPRVLVNHGLQAPTVEIQGKRQVNAEEMHRWSSPALHLQKGPTNHRKWV